MGILNRLFGKRWSIYFVTNENELHYVMHENSVVRMLGYLMGRFHEYGNPRPPWSIHLNFNKTNTSLPLLRTHFSANGDNLSQPLVNRLREIDPAFDTVRGGEPLFLEAATKKPLRISRYPMGASLDDMFKAAASNEATLFSVLDEVFGVSDE